MKLLLVDDHKNSAMVPTLAQDKSLKFGTTLIQFLYLQHMEDTILVIVIDK